MLKILKTSHIGPFQITKKRVLISISLLSTLLILGSLLGMKKGKSEMIRIEADPTKGFSTSYYLYIPKGIQSKEVNCILVEPNNTGMPSDDLSDHENEVNYLMENGFSRKLADAFNLPLLMPVFNRPESQWKMYTHSLDRDTLEETKGELARIDLQLIQMIEHSKGLLSERDILTSPKVVLYGFSASGSFVNRFTALHPERVQAVVSGGINYMPILPVAVSSDKELNYPIGINNIEKYTNEKFDLGLYSKIPQFIFMGSEDTNDTLYFDDAFNADEREVVLNVLGDNLLGRWNKSKQIYESKGIHAYFLLYEGVAHSITEAIESDIQKFLKPIVRP